MMQLSGIPLYNERHELIKMTTTEAVSKKRKRSETDLQHTEQDKRYRYVDMSPYLQLIS